MKTVPWMVAALALMALALPAAQPERRRTEAEQKAADLKALNERIERQQRQVQLDSSEVDRLNRALRDAERLVSRASGDLTKLRTQRAERSVARQRLVDERTRRESERDAAQTDLASQLRAAYFMGRNEPLKLLLNQRSPAEFGRNLTYYGYLGRLRAGQINQITENIAKIDSLTARIDEEDAALAELEVQQKQRVGELESARRQRGQVLTSLRRESRGRAAELANMKAQREQLEKLLKELSRAAQAAPYDPDSPFARLKNKLSWPVAGRIATNYGVRDSDGIDIDAEAGSAVRAVHDGVVRYADYMDQRGLMVILDHGDGYWSLYGHNGELFKSKDARVAAGEKIATVGDTGGRPRSGLYFEIRHAANPKKGPYKPVDPRSWFRTSAPPAR
jgi:murein hydrolase activator